MKIVSCALVTLLLLWGGNALGQQKPKPAGSQNKPAAATKPAPPAPPPQKPPEPPKPKASRVESMSPKELETLKAVIETSQGDITLEMYGQLAPNHVRQFLRLADQGYFNGTCFNRIVKGFVIQGGNPAMWPEDSPNRKIYFDAPKIKAEISNAVHDIGTLSMAHPGDDPDGGTSHFFICLKKASFLDGKFTAFGQVIEGMDVVEKIAATDVPEGSDKPSKRIEVKTIRVIYPD
ncbi:MAG: peptidylprolyl isomerase [Blastocatellia bacterium]|nr:peptidylprolyl isomerase [Blastocatellia bacterium]